MLHNIIPNEQIENIARHVRERRKVEEVLHPSAEQLRLMIDSVEDYAIFMLDPTGRVISWNLGAQRIKGYRATEIIGQHYSAFYTAEDQLRGLPDRILKTAAAVGRVEDEGWRVRQDGSRFWASVIMRSMRDASSTLIGFVKVTQDLSTRKQAAEVLRESEERYRSLFEHSLDAIFLTRPDGQILAANPAATQMFKMSEEELVRLGRDAIVDSTDPGFRELIEERERTGKAKGELTMRRGDGTLFPVVISSAVFHDNAQTPHTSMFIHDITEQKKTNEELTNRAFYDPLTQLPNRVLFMDRLNRQVEHAKRDRHRIFAVLFVDLDRFKLINDSLGHAAGDQLLIESAGRLKACVRANDTVSRLGGDEFTILLDGIDHLKSAIVTAERILQLLQQPFDLAGHQVVITASVGIAINSVGHTGAEELLREADSAMYRAKISGKARYTIFDDDAMHSDAM